MRSEIRHLAEILKESRRTVAFTGAGISVESGIQPFRGENGLWSTMDPGCLDLDRFYADPLQSWTIIRDVFYNAFNTAKPNVAHLMLALLEKKRVLRAVITQNIDNLHTKAGSQNVIEFHGTSRTLRCRACGVTSKATKQALRVLPPLCKKCGEVLKPDFVFFGEGIPEEAYMQSLIEAHRADVMLVIGTTGEVMPAATIPRLAKSNGATIVEINTEETSFTDTISDVFIQGKAAEVMGELEQQLSTIMK